MDYLAGFLAAVRLAVWAPAFFALAAAHRFRAASAIAFRPAALSLRFGLVTSVLASLSAARRFFWAAAIRFRPAASHPPSRPNRLVGGSS